MRIRLVRPTEQLKGQRLCLVIFAICLSARFIEYFLIETDKTAIGENVFHKIFGIVILAAVLKVTDIKWRDIGFQRGGSVSGILKGMLLGAAAGAAADMALHTNTVKKTAAGKAMQTATDAVDAAAASVKETMNR